MKHTILLVLALLVCTAFCADEIVNKKVVRDINLTTQVARHTITVTVENKGSSSVLKYELAVHQTSASNLAFISVSEENGATLQVATGQKSTQNSFTTYQVSLAKPLAAGDSVTLTVKYVFTHAQKPFPLQITQTEHQLVRYFGNHFFSSPYKTATQKTTIKLASNTVEDYSEKSPVKLSGDTLTYGSYEDIAPFSYSELRVHFENNSPFITATKLVKIFEISHWGNLAVEEHFDVKHDGAALKGSFSRFDFQRNPGSSPSAVLELVEILPNGASDVYYRDDIGNISTSTFRTSSKGLEFHIVPRFPLFGGWKNNFYTGYNLPLEAYLYTEKSDSSAFVLNTTFSTDIAEMVVDELVVKIILPEGAKDARVNVPFTVDTQSTEKHYTYLDTTGRTVLVIEKRNVVKEHNQYFQVHYSYSRLSMLHEPLLVAGALFAFFLAVIFYVRFEISITKVNKPATDLKSSTTVAAFNQHIKRFEKELKELQNAYKIIRDASVFKQERSNKISLYLNKTLQEASNVAGLLKKTNPALAERLQDIVDYETEKLHATIDLQDLEIEFKVGGSKGKGKYDKEREDYQRKYDDAVDGVEALQSETASFI